MRITGLPTFLSLILACLMLPAARAQDTVVYAARATSKFGPVPGLPTCTTGAVQNGDPSKGGSVILSKMAAGCTIPWHWHTPIEQVMLVSGIVKIEMKDGSPVTLHSGDYISLPSKHVHQAICQAACTMFVASNTAFDIHYVDKDGNEIPAPDVLKEKAKTPTK